MKILFVSDNFPPEVNAPASRTWEHAIRWVRAGHEVTVITCAPNFPRGKVFAGYRNEWRKVETIDGIRVVRVKSYIAGNVGFAKRILDYVSFMISATFFGQFERRPDVVVGTSPQFFAAIAGWLLGLTKWRPFVFELRDLWPASIVTVGAMRKGVVVRFLEKLELFLYRRARLIVSVTESFKLDLINRGIDGSKVVVVRNGVDIERFRPQKPSEALAARWGLRDKFVVAYLGTHGMAHRLDCVIEAARLLCDVPEVHFLFVGDGADKSKLVQLAGEIGLNNVTFVDPVCKDDMPDVWSVCNVALVHLKDDPVFASVIPSKIFEAFGMGLPVLLAQPDGEAADIVRSADAGITVSPEDPEALADAVRALLEDKKRLASFARNARAAAANHSRDRLAAEMLASLEGIVSRADTAS